MLGGGVSRLAWTAVESGPDNDNHMARSIRRKTMKTMIEAFGSHWRNRRFISCCAIDCVVFWLTFRWSVNISKSKKETATKDESTIRPSLGKSGQFRILDRLLIAGAERSWGSGVAATEMAEMVVVAYAGDISRASTICRSKTSSRARSIAS